LLTEVVNRAYALSGRRKISTAALLKSEPNTTRLIKKVEAAFKVMPPEVAEFDHFMPADWLIRNPAVLDEDTDDVRVTLNRAENLFNLLNGLVTSAA